jgi:hypothetical protein
MRSYFAVLLAYMAFFFGRVPALPPGRRQFYVDISIRVIDAPSVLFKGCSTRDVCMRSQQAGIDLRYLLHFSDSR